MNLKQCHLRRERQTEALVAALIAPLMALLIAVLIAAEILRQSAIREDEGRLIKNDYCYLIDNMVGSRLEF